MITQPLLRQRKGMRPLVLCCALMSAAPAVAFPAFELEVGGGATGREQIAPSFQGRVGLDLFDRVVVSLKGLSLSPVWQPAQQWGFLADAHVHTRGRFQVNGGLGVGFALATFLPTQDSGVETRLTTVSPFLLADVGVRLQLGHFFAGLNVGGWPWTPVWLATLTLGLKFGGEG